MYMCGWVGVCSLLFSCTLTAKKLILNIIIYLPLHNTYTHMSCVFVYVCVVCFFLVPLLHKNLS